ncbi:MBOAT family O-acyltransferase [Idiomarina piscisalsi]|uniref:MBOAT family O-acyltransferase n=1 Tax=Idiomarina piscisalsi TaxID=1096243 RepID=UPI00137E47EF|nr:MBOAT family O-acyltransferase [Idiomarina piscisalsi]MTJ01526.1 acyltransferase [Idiomarina piscisalsi]
MQNGMSLSRYVRKRNGVSLGAKGSMRNMLHRSLGASSFPVFWHYWNPIWGYYLSRHVMRPMGSFAPGWLAVFITFLVSGFVHDVAVSLVKWKLVVFFTPWFGLMGLLVIASKVLSVSYGSFPWGVRASINVLVISTTLTVVYAAEHLLYH